MTKKTKENLLEMSREHICALDNTNYEMWELVGELDDAIDTADKSKKYAEAFAHIGAIRERLVQLARDIDIDPGLAKAAR